MGQASAVNRKELWEVGGKNMNVITVKRKEEVSFENVLKCWRRRNTKNGDRKEKYEVWEGNTW
jgi:hypothetical protein